MYLHNELAFQRFQQALASEISAIENNDEKSKLRIEQLQLLAMAQSIHELIPLLKTIPHPKEIALMAGSRAMLDLILAETEAFVAAFSRDDMGAILYQACKVGHEELSIRLIEVLAWDVNKDKVANPFGSCYKSANGEYTFLDTVPVIEVAAQSKSLPLFTHVHALLNEESLQKLPAELVTAVASDSYEIASFLLDLGIDVNTEKMDYHRRGSYTAMSYLMSSRNKRLYELLLQRGATVDRFEKGYAISNGNIDLVRSMVAFGISFANDNMQREFILAACESGSVPMFRYVNETLMMPVYGPDMTTEQQRLYVNKEILKKVLTRGSVELFEHLESGLNLPLTSMMRNELDTIPNFNRETFPDYLALNAVCSYNLRLIRFLYETKGLLPSQSQLLFLLPYAYDNGRCAKQHDKFTTHAYIYSRTHADPEMRTLLSKAAMTSSLAELSTDELFVLYQDYTLNYPEDARRFQYQKFRENSTHLAREIAARKLSNENVLELAKANNGRLAAAVLFYLCISGEGFTDDNVKLILADSIFKPNHDYGRGRQALHFTLKFRGNALVQPLLALGADPDAFCEEFGTPVVMMSSSANELTLMLDSALSLQNSLRCCFRSDDVDLVSKILVKLEGKVTDLNFVSWLYQGLKAPTKVYNALCHLDDESFERAKRLISFSGVRDLHQLLKCAISFKETGEKPQELSDLEEKIKMGSMMFNLFGGSGCCGFPGLRIELGSDSDDDHDHTEGPGMV